jgi:lipopolysaccharide transport system ATP-binding protein
MAAPVIATRGLGKQFRIGASKKRGSTSTLQELLAEGFARRSRRGSEESDPDNYFWALRNVDLSVSAGEVVGIIGSNGSGKSTLLKILSDIVEPTEGRAELRGRVASLLEVGTGFHGQLTGRENIYLNGALIGMKVHEVRRNFDRIVEFSGVGKFLDTPVKKYSSGMYIRLAFAVAAHLETEVLIVDEVLAVGDFEFQQKCLGRMQEVASDGRTVLFVSHNVGVVESICSRCVLMDGGHLVEDGEPMPVAREYRRRMSRENGSPQVSLERFEGAARKIPVLRSARMLDEQGALNNYVAITRPLEIRVRVLLPAGLRNVVYVIRIESMYGMRMFSLMSPPYVKSEDIVGDHEITCTVKEFPLTPGTYRLGLGVISNNEMIDLITDVFFFTVSDGEVYGTKQRSTIGVCVTRAEWGVDERVLSMDASNDSEWLKIPATAGS